MTSKELKVEIRKLKKLKRACRAGSKERLELGRNIKELNLQLDALTVVDSAKDKVIKEILELDSVMKSIDIDLRKHTIEQLEFHLKKLKEKK